MFSLPCAPPPSPPADQERAELAAGRRHLEARQALYAELQTQLDNCPESVREQLQEQLRRVSSTSPLPLAPVGHRPDRRQESGGTGPPGPCSTCRTLGSVQWLGKGTGKVGWGSALQTAMSTKRAPPTEQREFGRWGRFLPQFPRVQPP